MQFLDGLCEFVLCVRRARVLQWHRCVCVFLPESANFLCRVRHERIGDRVCFAGGALVILLWCCNAIFGLQLYLCVIIPFSAHRCFAWLVFVSPVAPRCRYLCRFVDSAFSRGIVYQSVKL